MDPIEVVHYWFWKTLGDPSIRAYLAPLLADDPARPRAELSVFRLSGVLPGPSTDSLEDVPWVRFLPDFIEEFSTRLDQRPIARLHGPFERYQLIECMAAICGNSSQYEYFHIPELTSTQTAPGPGYIYGEFAVLGTASALRALWHDTGGAWLHGWTVFAWGESQTPLDIKVDPEVQLKNGDPSLYSAVLIALNQRKGGYLFLYTDRAREVWKAALDALRARHSIVES